MRRLLSISFCLLVCFGFAQDKYKFKTINSGAYAFGLSDHGLYSTGYYFSGSSRRAFFEAGNNVRQFGTLGGPESIGTDVNDSGKICGWSSRSSDQPGFGIATTFNRTTGQVSPIPVPGGFSNSYARGINSAGQIVGHQQNGNFDSTTGLKGFISSGLTSRQLAPIGGSSSLAIGISDQGVVSGGSTTATSGYWQPCLWIPTATNGTTFNIHMLNMGSFNYGVAGYVSKGRELIAGWAARQNERHRPVLWNDRLAVIQDLGLLAGFDEGFATAVNDFGEVVGFCVRHDGSGAVVEARGFVWDSSRGMRRLDQIVAPAGASIGPVRDIDNTGRTCGSNNSKATVFIPIFTPVLLVHGLWSGADKWHDSPQGMGRQITKLGFVNEAADFRTEQETLSHEASVEAQSRALARRISELRSRTGAGKIDLVCHSMGGLAARKYLQTPSLWPGGVNPVRKLITVATPHLGSDGALIDPILGVTAGRWANRGNNVDRVREWSPAVRDLCAEWMPGPLQTAGRSGAYPSSFKLTKWKKDNKTQYLSPILAVSNTFADDAQLILTGNDHDAVEEAQNTFDKLNVVNRGRQHIDYYKDMAALMMVKMGNGNSWGWNFRYVSPLIKSLAEGEASHAGTRVYLLAGTENVIKKLGPFEIAGPYTMTSDGLVPLGSALGVDPITGFDFFAGCPKVILDGEGSNHTDIINDPDAAHQVLAWLKMKP